MPHISQKITVTTFMVYFLFLLSKACKVGTQEGSDKGNDPIFFEVRPIEISRVYF